MSLDRLGENFNLNIFTPKKGVTNNQYPLYSLDNAEHTADTFLRSETTATNPIEKYNTSNIQNLYSPKQLLKAYTNSDFVEELIDNNPNVIKLLEDRGIDVKVHPENISKISNSHITTTTAYALNIANQMNISSADKQILEQACVFHDFGKILIPPEILQKPGALEGNEKVIMDLHSELGSELLKSTGMNNRVLNLIKNHHNPMTENSDILGQILSVADIYSALRENRSYKTSMSTEEAFKLLDQKAKNGEVSTEVVDALKASVISEAA